uniref:Uncharacterized protein n=1 Tax=Tetranychus urticae TaxID=32264 RepID=T1K337_TETUR
MPFRECNSTIYGMIGLLSTSGTSRTTRASPPPTKSRAQQSNSGASRTPQAAGSTSEGLAASSSSTRVEASSSAETISEYDYMFAWTVMPSDWLQKSSLNQLLLHYAVKFFAGLKSGSHFFESSTDYIENIKKLINCDIVPKLPSLQDKPKFVADYQIISPDGKLWQQFQLNELIRTEHLIKDKSYENYSFCISPLCKECSAKPNKKNSAAAKTALRHIYDLMGIKWHCVMCSMVFNTKTTHDSHVKACIYRERAAREHPVASKNYERQDSRKRDGRVTITAIGKTQLTINIWVEISLILALSSAFNINKTVRAICWFG